MPDYGLSRLTVEISPDDLPTRQSTIWRQAPYPAILHWKGRRSTGHIAFAGASTIDDYKKSFDVSSPDFAPRVWRFSAQNIDRSFLRSFIGFSIFQRMGLPVPKIEPVSVYVNRVYQGLYLAIEPIDEAFFSIRNIPVIAAYKGRFSGYDFDETIWHRLQDLTPAIVGDSYAPMLDLLQWLNDDTPPQLTEERLDHEQLLSYLAAAQTLDHFDGFRNNIILLFHKSDARLSFVPWDLDRILERPVPLKIEPVERLFHENRIYKTLFKDPSLRRQFRHRVDFLQQELQNPQWREGWQNFAKLIAEAFAADAVLQRAEAPLIQGEALEHRLMARIKCILDSLPTD